MKQAFGLVRRPWGVFHLKHKITGQQTSLKTNDKHEAQRILQAHNESECQPHFNLSLARVYLNGADPKLATRTSGGKSRRSRRSHGCPHWPVNTNSFKGFRCRGTSPNISYSVLESVFLEGENPDGFQKGPKLPPGSGVNRPEPGRCQSKMVFCENEARRFFGGLV